MIPCVWKIRLSEKNLTETQITIYNANQNHKGRALRSIHTEQKRTQNFAWKWLLYPF